MARDPVRSIWRRGEDLVPEYHAWETAGTLTTGKPIFGCSARRPRTAGLEVHPLTGASRTPRWQRRNDNSTMEDFTPRHGGLWQSRSNRPAGGHQRTLRKDNGEPESSGLVSDRRSRGCHGPTRWTSTFSGSMGLWLLCRAGDRGFIREKLLTAETQRKSKFWDWIAIAKEFSVFSASRPLKRV